MRFHIIGSLLLMVAPLFTACEESGSPSSKDKDQKINKDEITGYWYVHKAYRNGEHTKVLNNTFFNFTRDSMETNLPTQEGKMPYKWVEDEIVRESKNPTFYKVERLNRDSLEFLVNLRGYDFRMCLASVEIDTSESVQ